MAAKIYIVTKDNGRYDHCFSSAEKAIVYCNKKVLEQLARMGADLRIECFAEWGGETPVWNYTPNNVFTSNLTDGLYCCGCAYDIRETEPDGC